MSNSTIDAQRHDRIHIHIYIDGEVYEQLADRREIGQSVEELVDQIVGDEAGWLIARDQIQNREPVVASIEQVEDQWPAPPTSTTVEAKPRTKVKCACCPNGCLCPFPWRRMARCGCTPERLAFLREHGDYLK